MIAIGLAAAALGLLVLLAGRLHFMLHLFQLEHYENARLRVWVERRRARFDRRLLSLCAAAGVALVVAAVIDSKLLLPVVGILAGAVLAAEGVRILRRPQTKPLVFTPRARRVFGVALALPAVALVGAGVALVAGVELWVGPVVGAVVGAAGVVGAPELLFAANAAVKPIQALDNRRFVDRAKRRLAEIDPLVIGITGSFGKTTTKACVNAVAELRGPSYATPASFNSFLGVVRAINEGLSSKHRSFVVEMGAYRRRPLRCEVPSQRTGR